MNIRPYQKSDIEYILDRHQNLYAKEYGYNEVFYHYAKKTIVDFDSSTRRDREDIWIADSNGVPAGVIALVKTKDDGVGQIRWFLVEPEMRKSGVGSQLMDHLTEQAQKWGYRRLILWMASDLESALRFYHKRGFTETEREPNTEWTGSLLYEIKMEREL